MFSVIFDMDGTLLDTQRICVPAWEYAGKLQGFEGVGNCIYSVCGMNEAGWTKFLRDHHPDIDADEFKVQIHKYYEENLVIRFKPGAKELLDFFKENNIKMAIASGSAKETIEDHLKQVGVLGYFGAIAGSSDVKNGKPAPDVFLLAAERLGVNPANCFVFEDSSNGIRAGCTAGMKCIGVPDLTQFSDDVKKLMFAHITDLSQAIPIFKKELLKCEI